MSPVSIGVRPHSTLQEVLACGSVVERNSTHFALSTETRGPRLRLPMRRPASRLLARLVLTTAAVSLSAAAVAAAGNGCSDPCTCNGRLGALRVVPAAKLLECIGGGRPVDLQHVQVVGGLDLGSLPETDLDGGARVRLSGLPSPRAILLLDVLEREAGRLVPGARIVRERLSIRDSVIEGALTAPLPRPGVATPYSPVAFLQTVNLSGTTLAGRLDLSHTRFRLPLVANGVRFMRSVTFRGSRFADNAIFNGARFQCRTSFMEAAFERQAQFEGVDVHSEITFDRASFEQGAHFQSRAGGQTRLNNARFTEARFKGGRSVFEDVKWSGPARFTKAGFEAGAAFSRSEFGSDAHFEDVVFVGETAFNAARFHASASFARVIFDAKPLASFDKAEFRDADFTRARFSSAADFVGATFHSASFLDVDFGGPADFRRVHAVKVVQFGAAGAKTTFQGSAAFDFAQLPLASFENAAFRGRASFVGTQFGGPPCGTAPTVVIDFSGSAFADLVNFESATFLGQVNLSRAGFDPGRARVRWRQIESAITSAAVELVDDGSCAAGKRFAAAAGAGPMPRVDLLRLLERNFRSQELGTDANAVLYLKEDEETRVELGREQSVWAKARLLAYLVLFGWTSGYGLWPSRVLCLLVIVLGVFALVYSVFGRWPARFRESSESRFRFRVMELPLAPRTLLPLRRVNNMLAASCVSLAALVNFELWGAHLEVGPRERFYWVVAFERIIGWALLILLGISIKNTVPLVSQFLGWLI